MTASTLSIQTTAQTDAQHFESLYAEARGNAELIPWADEIPTPSLVTWLNAVAPSIIRCGARVCVVGCGLGDDARELMSRGYDVTAFDCSPTAIEWAKQNDPENARCYFAADLFAMPARWRHRFDLVVEVNTIQALAPSMQMGAVKALSELVSPNGHMLVICRATDEPAHVEDGPPWALTQKQLMDWTSYVQLVPDSAVQDFMDDEDPPVRRIRALFKRA